MTTTRADLARRWWASLSDEERAAHRSSLVRSAELMRELNRPPPKKELDRPAGEGVE
jgi:hypothetical protein